MVIPTRESGKATLGMGQVLAGISMATFMQESGGPMQRMGGENSCWLMELSMWVVSGPTKGAGGERIIGIMVKYQWGCSKMISFMVKVFAGVQTSRPLGCWTLD